MKIFSSPSRRGMRRSAWSSLLGMLCLLASTHAHAQWLVYDEDVYNKIDNLNSQLSMRTDTNSTTGLVGKGPSISDSGDGISLDFSKGAQSAGLLSSVTDYAKQWAADLLGLSSGNGNFGTMRTNTQSLLNFSNGSDSYDGSVASIAGSLTSSLGLSSALSAAGIETGPYATAAKQFYGSGANGLTPNCNDSAIGTKYGRLLYQNCLKARNVLAAQLQQISDISKVLDERNDTLQRMLQNSNVDKTRDLQLRQYKLTALQTLIANDQMRLQAAMASYQALRQLYDEKRAEAQQALTTGKSADFMSNAIGTLVSALGAAGGMAVGKEAADAVQTSIGVPNMFDRAVYDSSQARINKAFGYSAP